MLELTEQLITYFDYLDVKNYSLGTGTGLVPTIILTRIPNVC